MQGASRRPGGAETRRSFTQGSSVLRFNSKLKEQALHQPEMGDQEDTSRDLTLIPPYAPHPHPVLAW